MIHENGVDGVMKSLIIKILKKNNYQVLEKEIKKEEVKNYDGAFFCNSVRSIWNIKSIEKLKYKENKFIKNIIELVNNEIYK